MTTYYHVFYASAPDGGYADFGASRPLKFLPEEGPVDDWCPQQLVLQLGAPVDYLQVVLMGRGCSLRFRQLIERHASLKDEMQWLPFLVTERNSVCQLPYFHLHFPNPPDVLHPDLTHFSSEGILLKPVLSSERAAEHHVFSYRGGGSIALCISESVKRAIEAHALTGMLFTPALVS